MIGVMEINKGGKENMALKGLIFNRVVRKPLLRKYLVVNIEGDE